MKVSLVVPCYNEETNLQKGVLDKIGNYVKDNEKFGEVIIVDDGSQDKSKIIIGEKYLPMFPKFRLIENNHGGKAMAVITGIRNAKEEYVMFTDMDLATPIEQANRLIKRVSKTYPIVIGSRNNKREGAPILRKIMARGGIIVKDLLVNLKGVRDTQCGFKLFNRKTALDIIRRLQVSVNHKDIKGSSVSAGFDVEFLFLATKLGYGIKEIPVSWKHVETHNVNFLKDSLEGLRDYIRIRYYDLTGKYDLKK